MALRNPHCYEWVWTRPGSFCYPPLVGGITVAASEAHCLAAQSLHVSALETEEAKKIYSCVCIDENSLGFGPKLQLLEVPYYRAPSLIPGAQYTEGKTGQFGHGLIKWKKHIPTQTQVLLPSKAEAFTDSLASRCFLSLLIQTHKVATSYLANVGQAASKS